MATGTTPRRKICPQCQGSGNWGYWYNSTTHVSTYCDVCRGNGIVTPYTYRKYIGRQPQHQEAG